MPASPRDQWSASWLDIGTTILDARSNLLRDNILANAEHARNPRPSEPYEGNIIYFPNILVANIENIGNLFRSVLRSENLLGAAMTDPSREEIKAEIRAAEARGDTKITRFEGKLELVLSKLEDVRQDNRTTRANQWVIGLGLAVLIVTVVALIPVFFSIGSQIRDLVRAEVHEQLPAPAARTSTQK